MKTNADSLNDPLSPQLRDMVNDSPDLTGLHMAAELYASILPLIRDADLSPGNMSVTPEEARGKLDAGLPFLADLDLSLDFMAARELMIALASELESFYEHAGLEMQLASARRIRLSLEEDRLDADDLLSDIAAGTNSSIGRAAMLQQLEPDLLRMLCINTLRPALREWGRQLQPLAEKYNWRKNYCFVCGAAPAFGELRDDHHSKYLRCSQCGADWPAPRLQCAHCGNDDHKSLGYLYSEPHPEKILAEFCDSCKGYLKLITTFGPMPADMLPAEDLATLYLDYAARDRGYSREAKKGFAGCQNLNSHFCNLA
jgi:hypothetical protein